jgi:Phytanoyl-CoA dioxygenase (PhyH)
MMTVGRNGFRLVPALLSPEEVLELRDAIKDCIDRAASAMLTPFETSCPGVPLEERLGRVAQFDRAYASALLQVVMADVQRDRRLMALACHPALCRVVAEEMSPEVPTGHVIRARAAIPAFESRISPWHQDVTRPDAKTGCARVRLACWIPLSDVDEHSGSLEVIPGTWSAPLRHVMRDDGHFEIARDVMSAEGACAVPMRAGDVLLLDRFVPHRALPTSGRQGRWSAVVWVKTGGPSAC